MRPHRVEAVRLLEAGVVVEGSEQREPGARAVDAGEGDRAVECDDGARSDALQHLVQGEDLRPVGRRIRRRLVVHGRDRGLHLIRTDRPGAQGALDQGDALGDLAGIPERAVLLGERDELAGALAGRPGARR